MGSPKTRSLLRIARAAVPDHVDRPAPSPGTRITPIRRVTPGQPAPVCPPVRAPLASGVPEDARAAACTSSRGATFGGLGLDTGTRAGQVTSMAPELRTFVDRVIVPALLERFLREPASATPEAPSDRPAA